MNPDGTYLIVGGTGGLGKAVLRLLADLGAKRVVTLSRSGADSQAMQEMIAEMSMKGVEVIAHQGSVMDKEAIEQVKSSCSQYPIRGVIQGAMVLRDSRVENMTYQDWRIAMEPKVYGTWNLHEAFGSSLDFFVLLSSSGGIVGSFSQGNYCAGNTFQDAFARYRAGLQLSGKSLIAPRLQNPDMFSRSDHQRRVRRGRRLHGRERISSRICSAPRPHFLQARRVLGHHQGGHREPYRKNGQ